MRQRFNLVHNTSTITEIYVTEISTMLTKSPRPIFFHKGFEPLQKAGNAFIEAPIMDFPAFAW